MDWATIFFLESDVFYFAKSECNYVFIPILMVEMDSTPSKPLGHPKFQNLKTVTWIFKNADQILSKSCLKNQRIRTQIIKILDYAIIWVLKNQEMCRDIIRSTCILQTPMLTVCLHASFKPLC